MLNDGFHNYIFDGEERISQVDNGSTKYTYDPDGRRVRKDVSNQPSIEYLYFGGQLLAEHNLTSVNWSDYIYANGHRIAKADTFYDLLETQGTCNTPSQGCRSTFWFRNSGLTGYRIQSGDKLFIAQYNPSSTTVAGPGLTYRDANGNLTNGDTITNVFDQDGCAMNQDCASFAGKWHYRRMDLTPLAGMTVADDPLVETAYTTTSNTTWAVFYTYYSLVSTDGTVHPIFVGTMNGVTLNMSTWNQSGASGLTYNPYSNGCPVSCVLQDTTYYHGDQIGSSRLLTVSGGWPVWQGTFLPYGEEYNPEITTNHYKFSGKERDSETNLDYFGGRYYANSLGRFLTPDWAAKPSPVPYAEMGDPQTLNLYTYVRNVPTTDLDRDGHASLAWERIKAVRVAWRQEQELVRKTGRGTRNWTAAERAELLARGKVKGYYGHHINSVKGNPGQAGNPDNIEFRTPQDHLDAHGGSWQNPTTGEFLSRSLAVLQATDSIINAIGYHQMEELTGIGESVLSKLADFAGAGPGFGNLYIIDPAKAAVTLDGESIDVFGEEGKTETFDVRDGQYFQRGSKKPTDPNKMKGAEFEIHNKKDDA